MIYLDNGATTYPKPCSVSESVMNALRFTAGSPGRGGHSQTIKAGETVYRTREIIAEMFSCESENVIFTDNCTTSLNTAIKGVCKKGDRVLTSSLEHNSVLRPLEKLREKGIISFGIFRVSPQNDEETLEGIRSLMSLKPKAIVCTFASNVFGTVLPIERIGRLCRESDVIFIVDGAQAAGSIKIDMKKMNIDILCLPGHKGLYGPMGTGLMLLSGRVMPEELTQGGTGSYSMDEKQPHSVPDRYESGTLNFPGIAGLYSGVRFIRSCGGEDAVHGKEMELIDILESDLSAVRHIRLYPEMKSALRSPILSFNVDGFHSEEVSSLLDKCGVAVRAGYHCAKLAHESYGTSEIGCVRVTPGFFNTKKDIKNFVFYCNKIAMRQKI
ncbi:MAG: aminotransferase class V-fold PLP-dependent enzyme [Ruminococcaceae bacterium]|nr:aminotransferase class V-fold PLP-dependent enzyme [Oscillospiraceae bacterium]